MKVLFVSRENPHMGMSPIVKNQAESLMRIGLDVEFFLIKGSGLSGYIKSVYPLRKRIKRIKYNIIHSHYSLSAFTATMAGAKPIVVSLMGSDVNAHGLVKIFIKTLRFFFWDATIIKSQEMNRKLNLKNVHVIPNGVNFNMFYSYNKQEAKQRIGFDPEKKHIIFIADPTRPEKNFSLAKESVSLINEKNVELFVVYNEVGVNHSSIPDYMNAADVLLLTSKWEGSPNVIKEAMACGLPIVSTNVGDVKKTIDNTAGCYLCSFKAQDIASKISQALNFHGRTKGRENIKHLDSSVIAEKVRTVYNTVIRNN